MLFPRRCPLVVAFLGLMAVAAACLPCAVTAQAAPAVPAKPTLFVLAIGVSQYQDPANNLRFPAKDALGLTARFQRGEGKLFGKVVVTTLTDKAATRDGIVRSLVLLRKRAPQMGPDDCTLLVAVGHGTRDDLGQYFFAPYDIDPDNIDVTGVPWTTFAVSLAALPGHVLVLLDTAHAGGVDGPPNAAVFAACGAGELSQESTDWSGGAFSTTLLAGLGGAADDNHDGTVTLAELAGYTRRRVAALTKNAQNPVLVKPAAFPGDLPLGSVTPVR